MNKINKEIKGARLASVAHTRWAFYEAMEVEDLQCMADYFETLYAHYQNRGKRSKTITLTKE